MAIDLLLTQKKLEKALAVLGYEPMESEIDDGVFSLGFNASLKDFDDADCMFNIAVFNNGRMTFTATFDVVSLNEMSYGLLNGFNERSTFLYAYVDTGIGCLTFCYNELNCLSEENAASVFLSCYDELCGMDNRRLIQPLVKLTHKI